MTILNQINFDFFFVKSTLIFCALFVTINCMHDVYITNETEYFKRFDKLGHAGLYLFKGYNF